MNTPEDEKKIIIDEDWKSQVQQEKERLKQQTPGQQQQTPGQEGAAAGEDRPAAAATESSDHDEQMSAGRLPPPSFEWLISSLATQAFASLGQLPDPVDQTIRTDLELAKHHIDLLAMLEEKTRGNLSEDEAAMLESLLHQLRLVFVSVGRS